MKNKINGKKYNNNLYSYQRNEPTRNPQPSKEKLGDLIATYLKSNWIDLFVKISIPVCVYFMIDSKVDNARVCEKLINQEKLNDQYNRTIEKLQDSYLDQELRIKVIEAKIDTHKNGSI